MTKVKETTFSLNEKNIQKLINKHCAKGRMGYVKFLKANGKERKMWFVKVRDHHLTHPNVLTPEDQKLAAEKKLADQLTTIYDIREKGIRSFKWARVLELSVGGRKYVR